MHHSPFANPELWVLIAFLLFLGAFGRQMWRALAGVLDDRAASVRAELAEAQRLRLQAESMLAQATRDRDATLADAADMLARARSEAARLAEAARAETEASTRRRERMAMERIAAAEKSAVDDVRQAAAEVAVRATERVIAAGLGDHAEEAIVDAAIAALPRALRAA